MPGKNRLRILIGDDHSLVAAGLKNLLEPEFDVVGISSDGRALLEAAERLRPEVVLVDIAMPRLNGLDAGRRILASLPGTKVIHLTMTSDPQIEREAMSYGASAFLQKTVGRRGLVEAIHTACGTCEQISNLRERRGADLYAQKTIELTNRQRDVLQLLAEGYSMKQVGGVLSLATRTVAFHKYRIMEMLGLANDAELIQFAVKNHFLFVTREEGAGHGRTARDRHSEASKSSRALAA
jgi:DNA-binding NarL/FixJ family response regulator